MASMAADTSQSENQEPFEVSLVSHTPHLLYKLTPAQVQTCPLDTNTKKTVFSLLHIWERTSYRILLLWLELQWA